MDFRDLDPLLLESLHEDIGRGDITTDSVLAGVPADARMSRGVVVAKKPLVLAGWPLFVRVFELLGDVDVECPFSESEHIAQGSELGILHAEMAVLLKGERVALNLLQRCCGVATLTRRFVERIRHTKARILDTRKTTPLWRAVEKYAVRKGGGVNHRLGLDDAVLLKENHIALVGGISQAVEACRRSLSHLHKIEVEVRGLDELDQAIQAGADIVMLDNMTPNEVKEAVLHAAGRCVIEVSGGVNEDNVAAYAEAGADFISIGALTHSYQASDISLLVKPV
jgi:nicotinate-nucleotide pyrophosphorylase (carboxylating)